ncbi:MAG: F0F1 ATP synthase subunit delta [Nocardioides sp.]
MDLRGASGDALAGLTQELGSTTGDLATLGGELYALAQLLREQVSLRRLVTDPSVAAEAKQGVMDGLLAGKVSDAARAVLGSAVGRRWTGSRDLPDAVERLSEIAQVRSAGDRSTVVADELFAFAQAVRANPTLRDALTDSARSVSDRAGLVRDLLDGKAHPATVALATQSLGGGYRNPLAALAAYQDVAASVRGEGVATVRVSRPLSSAHAERLAAALATRYGHAVHLNVVVDPAVLGGISVEIGDDVIDGTVSSRLAEAGRRLAG